MKIYNSQLVMGLVYRSTLELLQSNLQVITMAWYREILVWAPSWLASCAPCVTWCKTTGPVYFISQDKIQERENKRCFKDTTYKY